MPSGAHESPIALAKLDPGVLVWLLANLFDVKVPDYHHARPHATDVRVVVPRTYHADGMMLLCDPDDRPVLAIVLEVQLNWDKAKRRTWRLYVAQIEAELDVTAALLVYCPDPALARSYRGLFETDGLSLLLRPFIFTSSDMPVITDTELARASPALAVLSALCHSGHAEVDSTFPALVEALRSAGVDKAILYHDIVLAALPVPARVRWEAFVTTTAGHQFLSEEFRKAAAEGWAQGEAHGEAHSVLTVLEARGVSVPEEIRERILTCTDLTQLDTWLRRASTATTAAEVVD